MYKEAEVQTLCYDKQTSKQNENRTKKNISLKVSHFGQSLTGKRKSRQKTEENVENPEWESVPLSSWKLVQVSFLKRPTSNGEFFNHVIGKTVNKVTWWFSSGKIKFWLFMLESI